MTESVLASLLAAVAGMAFVFALERRRDRLVSERLGEPSPRRRSRTAPRVLSAIGGWAVRGSVARRLLDPRRVSARLEGAGIGTSQEVVMGGAWLAACSAGLLVLLVPSPLRVLAPVVALAVLRGPGFVLARLERQRKAQADAELPQLLDLLAAASSAGLSGPAALQRSVSVTTGPLADELSRALRAVELGGRWRGELRLMADRLELSDLGRAVSALTRSGSLGSSLAEAVSTLAAEVRADRRARAAERARKAPVTMLFPLVFLVLPAFLLLTVVPVLITTLRSIR